MFPLLLAVDHWWVFIWSCMWYLQLYISHVSRGQMAIWLWTAEAAIAAALELTNNMTWRMLPTFLNVNQNSILYLNQSKAIYWVTRFQYISNETSVFSNSFTKHITERNNEINLRFQYCQMDFHTWFSSHSHTHTRNVQKAKTNRQYNKTENWNQINRASCDLRR